MNRRRRALLLLAAATVAGLLAAVTVSGRDRSVNNTFGSLRPVVVATGDLDPGRVLGRQRIGRQLEVRQVPEMFVPAAALARPAEATGLKPAVPVPAGSYLTANLLRSPRTGRRQSLTGRGRSPVELEVSGAGALAGSSGRVDVLVTSEPATGGSGRTVTVARAVPLLAVGQPGDGEAGPGLTRVTLGLTPAEARRLIHAESFARRITLLPKAARR